MEKMIKRQMAIPLQTPTDSHYTPEQWQAIHQEGNHVLVSASAGSGKTRVLVQRIMQKLTRGHAIKDLLVVTFTELAASEMKERIERELQQLINQEFEGAIRTHYLRQMADLPTANISTIDAFCRQIIQRYYYMIGLDPVFRLVTDKTELMMQRDEVWLELKEKLLTEENPHYIALMENFSNGRSDTALDAVIYALYDKARVHADPAAWLEQLLRHYQADDQTTFRHIYQEFIQPHSLAEVSELSRQLSHQREYIPARTAAGFDKLAASLTEQLAYLAAVQASLATGSYEAVFQIVNQQPWPALPRRNKKDFDDDELLIEEQIKIKAQNDDLKKQFTDHFQNKYFAFNEATQVSFLQEAKQVATALVAVEQEFITAMAAYKAANRVMDFADIELAAYQILTATAAAGRHNEAAAFYQERFSEVMIDEYQDVNALQEAILQAVSHQKEDKNMFMVGDVKQSIYRFRFAEPELFVNKYQNYANQADVNAAGQRIILQNNFRSREDVLYFTNYIFEQIMDVNIGQIDYDAAAQLKYGFKKFPASADHHTELLLFDKKTAAPATEAEDGDLESEAAQVEMLAQKIIDLHDRHFAIYDKKLDCERPLRYSDIVILSSTRNHHLQVEQTFKKYGIPLQMDNLTNYFKRIEISIMVSVLKWIDNPFQDIPLAAILRSPIVGLTEPEMAEIRLADQQVSYYEAFLAYLDQADQTSELYQKLRRLNDWQQKWRDIARDQPLAYLIWQIYNDTGFLDYVVGMPNGLQRQNNLHGFYRRADDFEKSAFRGLFQFIRYIENIQKKEEDLAEPKTIDADQNVVQLMTIHGSKGLEYPVVFYLNISKRFNDQDLKGKVIYNDGYGLGVALKNRQKHISYPNLMQLLVKDSEKQDLYAEEMRKLYVALTRAEQKLILVGTIADAAATFTKWAQQGGSNRLLPATTRLKAGSPLDWIGPALIRHHDFDAINRAGVVDEYQPPLNPFHFEVKVQTAEQIQAQSRQITGPTGGADGEAATEIQFSPLAGADRQPIAIPALDFNYAFEPATRTTSYQSVSELKRLYHDPANSDMAVWLDGTIESAGAGNRFVEQEYPKPDFMVEQQAVTAAEIGSATHLLMQNIDLAALPDQAAFEQLFDKLAARELIRTEIKPRLDFARLVSFFATDMGRLLLTRRERLRREQTFSLSLPANKIFAGTAGADQLLIHGTIDGFILADDEILLYDFKTDQLSYLSEEQQRQQVRARYQTQMDLYAAALETIYDRPVRHKVIIALEPMTAFFL